MIISLLAPLILTGSFSHATSLGEKLISRYVEFNDVRILTEFNGQRVYARVNATATERDPRGSAVNFCKSLGFDRVYYSTSSENHFGEKLILARIDESGGIFDVREDGGNPFHRSILCSH